jgi:hypothetical protein
MNPKSDPIPAHDLFVAALLTPPEQREACLAGDYGGDEVLRQRVTDLLAAGCVE